MTARRSLARGYSDSACEVLIRDDRAIVHDKSTDSYYSCSPSRIPPDILGRTVNRREMIPSWVAFAIVVSGLVLLTLNIAYSLHTREGASPRFFMWFAPYIVLSIVVHELAHMAMLWRFGRRHDHVGFRLHYVILPAFYVRMNQSLLLTRHERVAVHAAGIWVNLAINSILIVVNSVYLDNPDLAASLAFATVTLAANAVPALNSDGYRVLLALARQDELREHRQNPAWIRAVKVVSWLLVVAYGLYISIDLYLGLLHG